MNDDATELRQFAETAKLDAGEIAARTAGIHAAVLSLSKYLDGPNFTKIHPADVRLMFHAYDAAFFEGRIRRTLGASPLEFGLSRRMTRAGGQTRRWRDRETGLLSYEISVATSILFGCFQDDDHRPIIASGIVCQDRLDAMQRVMEHEIAHLVELTAWGESSCNQPPFQAMTLNLFGHTDNKHNLITPRERIVVKYGIQPGMTVRFRFEGAEHTGIVNRINKRATVLVENPKGRRYSNGKHYLKFYVPAGALTPVK